MLIKSHSLSRAALGVCGLLMVAAPAAAVMPAPAGTIPPEVVEAFDARRFELPDLAGRLGTSAAQTVWNVPVILVGFSDQPFSSSIYGSRTAVQYFEQTLFDTTGATATGSVFDYYRWVSGDRIRVVGRVVATISLAEPKNWYALNSYGLRPSAPQNMYGFVSNTLQFADSSVDWRPFDRDQDGFVDMLWVVHSGLPGEATVTGDNLWSVTSRLTAWPSGESFETRTPRPGAPSIRMRIDRFSVLPELSAIRPNTPAEIGVYCHEFGHALGLPDLYDTGTLGGGTNVGPGNWSLMGTGSYGTDGQSPEFPAHLGAWPMKWLGWRTPARPANDSLIVLPPLASGGAPIEFWFQGEPNAEHFLIENRQRQGFDRYLPAEGLIVYQIDETVLTPLAVASNRVNAGPRPGLRLVEADGYNDLSQGRNRGDEHDPFPGFFARTVFDDATTPSTRSFRGVPTNIALREIEPIGDDMRFLLQVRAPGWEPAAAATPGGYNPIWPSSAANRSLRLASGVVVTVMAERRAGRPQIVLRSRPALGAWDEGLQLSEGPVSSSDPCIAALPGGDDLVVSWSDGRHGSGELYYRSRIGGVWSPERRLTDLAGDSRYPTLGVDRFGRVHLAWLYTDATATQVRFMTFTYFSPFGTPLEVTSTLRVPDTPVIAVGPGGVSHLFWSDRATSPSSVWFTTYSTATGLAPPQLVAASSFAQPAVDATADRDGGVHVVWQVSGSGGVNQVRYQWRPPGGGAPRPADTVIVSRGESVQNPVVRVDPELGVHVAYIAINGGIPQVRYKRRDPVAGWDYGGTEVTRVAQGGAARPQLLPGAGGEVAVLYLQPTATHDILMERRRYPPLGAVAVPGPDVIPPSVALRMGPNPLRAGSPLILRVPGAWFGSGESLDLYDLAGRRVASARLLTDGPSATAEIPGSVTGAWASGVYFARLRKGAAQAARLVVLR